jgi:hypothetical protein
VSIYAFFRAVSPVVGGIEDVISGVSLATSPLALGQWLNSSIAS